jgi:hypothetical protein
MNMSRNFTLGGLIALSMIMGACAQFETSHETLTPAAPSPLPGGSANGELVGIWLPEIGVAAPSPSSCGNFQWEITSQSDTAIQGNFAAECGGGVTISATVHGTLDNPTTVTVHIQGTGNVSGLGCPFTLDGVGTLSDNNRALTIPYTGTTCFGPMSGTETIRRPSPPPPPEPEPAPPQGGGPNPEHVGGSGFSALRAEQIVVATGNEFPSLLAPIGDVGQKMGNAEELLLRMIWHMHLAGYQAARQRNPSGAISLDKLNVVLDDGRWHAFDVMTNFDIPGVDTRVIFFEVTPPDPIANDGISD